MSSYISSPLKLLWKLIILFILIVSTGCAKPSPKIEVTKSARIGIINILENKMTHTHVGTTVLTNFKKTYDMEWNIPELIQSELIAQLKKINLTTINIDPTPQIIDKEDKLLNNAWSKGHLNRSLTEDFKQLGIKYNVDLIFVIHSIPEKDNLWGPYILNEEKNETSYHSVDNCFLLFIHGCISGRGRRGGIRPVFESV